jgi:hypothetical protein
MAKSFAEYNQADCTCDRQPSFWDEASWLKQPPQRQNQEHPIMLQHDPPDFKGAQHGSEL